MPQFLPKSLDIAVTQQPRHAVLRADFAVGRN